MERACVCGVAGVPGTAGVGAATDTVDGNSARGKDRGKDRGSMAVAAATAI